jgi:hemoglobin
MQNTAEPTIFETIGGEPSIDAAVDIFYEKILADERINGFFAKTEMTKLKEHQRRFLTVAFGGPNRYTGRTMRAAHKDMGLTDDHFNAVAENLTATLRDLKVNEELITKILTLVDGTRPDVLNR